MLIYSKLITLKWIKQTAKNSSHVFTPIVCDVCKTVPSDILDTAGHKIQKHCRYSPAHNSFTEIQWSKIFSIKINIYNKLQMCCQWYKLSWPPASGSVGISGTEEPSADKILNRKLPSWGNFGQYGPTTVKVIPYHTSEHIPAFSYHGLNSTIKFSGSIIIIIVKRGSKIEVIIIGFIKEQITFGITKCSASKPQNNNIHN